MMKGLRENGHEVHLCYYDFDERGHQKNKMEYFVCGIAGDGSVPESFYPVVEDYIGEGGNFERPLALVRNEQGVPAGTHVEWL